MKLAAQSSSRQIGELTRNEKAADCCRHAKELEKAGEYEAARESLTTFWPADGDSPIIDGLDRRIAGDVLLRVGSLIGWLGGARHSDRQESAKDLITRSIEIFNALHDTEKVAEAFSDLALCYWREGGFNEARVNLKQAADLVSTENCDLMALILIRAAEVERSAGSLFDALRLLEKAAEILDQNDQASLRGSLSLCRGATFTSFAAADYRKDLIDSALIEYAAASVYFEEAGHVRQRGRVENNLGFLYQSIGKFREAHEHISRARHIFVSLGDPGHIAQVDDTRARTFLAEGRFDEGERYARMAVKTLSGGDECSLLVEALTTHGVALARLGRFSSARGQFDRAIKAGESCGDLEGAGRAKLSIIEELARQTSSIELAAIHKSAIELLQRSQDPSMRKRLITTATVVIDALLTEETETEGLQPQSWAGFSIKRELRAFEKKVLERALRDAGGSVTLASRLLGFKHHQSLISLINTRHQDLLKTRSTVRKRRRTILAKGTERKKTKGPAGKSSAKLISVLHVEDDKQVANVIRDYLIGEGMEVDSCGNGMTALRVLTGDARYDVLIVDNDLPGLSGLELVRRVRKITHRRKTPIIMFSSDDVETEAWRAGVEEFLRKPQDLDRVASTVERLMSPTAQKRSD
jgi:CheY-like chemotaxis protein